MKIRAYIASSAQNETVEYELEQLAGWLQHTLRCTIIPGHYKQLTLVVDYPPPYWATFTYEVVQE